MILVYKTFFLPCMPESSRTVDHHFCAGRDIADVLENEGKKECFFELENHDLALQRRGKNMRWFQVSRLLAFSKNAHRGIATYVYARAGRAEVRLS